jgi:hypothetical protein
VTPSILRLHEAIAKAQALLGLVALAVDFWMLARAVGVGFADIARCFYRPAAVAAAMILVLYGLDHVAQLPLAASLMVKIAAGGGVNLGCLTAVWFLAGRPDGIEAIAIASAATALRRAMRRGRPEALRSEH